MKSLFFICLLLVLYGTTLSEIREYFYISDQMDFTTAGGYCRQHYGHLAVITTEEEYKKAVSFTPTLSPAWIGLTRAAPNVSTWLWSNGVKTNFTKWNSGEPDNRSPGENCVVMNMYGWFDTGCGGGGFSVLCSRRFTLVKENKTWEEALQHCRKRYKNLAFMGSEGLHTDHLRILELETQTVKVWTGLRFLNGKWFWVNWAPMGSLVSLPQCPIHPYRCGAYNFNTSVWENRDCNEKMNFICYN